jgi:hypothetical protein
MLANQWWRGQGLLEATKHIEQHTEVLGGAPEQRRLVTVHNIEHLGHGVSGGSTRANNRELGHGRSDWARTEVSSAGSVAWMLDVLELMPRARLILPQRTRSLHVDGQRARRLHQTRRRGGGSGERGWIPRIYRASTLRQIDLGSSTAERPSERRERIGRQTRILICFACN